MTLFHGDCLEILPTLPADSVDAGVTDPPYHLQSIHKRFAAKGRNETSERYAAGPYGRHATGFMGKGWDGGDIAMRPETWAAVFRVLKPGAHLLAFGGTRTHHRIWCAIEDAGFEIRDTIFWLYGSGFPKSHNTGTGWGTALKPAAEPIILARKPLVGTVAANMAAYGTGAINIDVSRTPEGRWPANVIHDGSDEVLAAFPEAVGQIADASSSSSSRKNQNVYGAMKRGNGREGEPSADSDNEGAVGFKMKPGTRRADSGSAARFFYCAKASKSDREEGCAALPDRVGGQRSETSGQHITRRDGGDPGKVKNNHPTVKPNALMRYLCRLVTPPGGTVLDPFTGSGSTGKAAVAEGFRFVGIERDDEYVPIARARIAHAEQQAVAEVFG